MWRKLTVGGFLILWISGYSWYLCHDESDTKETTDSEETIKKTATGDPSPSSQKSNVPPRSTEPLKLKQPNTKIINQGDTPENALNIAIRFHWLAYLRSPIVTKEQIAYELFQITTSQVYEQLEITESDQEQKWKSIMASPVRQKGEDWIISTVAVIDEQQTSLYLQVGEEDGRWKVRKILKAPY